MTAPNNTRTHMNTHKTSYMVGGGSALECSQTFHLYARHRYDGPTPQSRTAESALQYCQPIVFVNVLCWNAVCKTMNQSRYAQCHLSEQGRRKPEDASCFQVPPTAFASGVATWPSYNVSCMKVLKQRNYCRF